MAAVTTRRTRSGVMRQRDPSWTSTTVWEHWLACRLPELSLKPVQLTFELDPDPLRVTEPQFTCFAASQLSERVA